MEFQKFNNTTKPAIQVLVGNDDEHKFQSILQVIMLFAHYLVALPVFILCWYALISCLRRRGHITQREATEMMDELQRIPLPKAGPVLFSKRAGVVV